MSHSASVSLIFLQYTKLGWLRDEFPGVPFMAVTATANMQAVQDIIHRLNIDGCKSFTMSFNRSNLFYEVRKKRNDPSTLADVTEFIKTNYPVDTGIVYCNNKIKCDSFAERFRQQGIRAASYHADLTPEVRSQLQQDWQSGKLQLIVATVRTVIFVRLDA
jgi:bloom syndrome protein